MVMFPECMSSGALVGGTLLHTWWCGVHDEGVWPEEDRLLAELAQSFIDEMHTWTVA